MTTNIRLGILRAHSIYLVVASTLGLIMDIRGVFFASGPEHLIVQSAPFAGLGFIEAHGLALILGVVLARVPASRSWHLIGAASVALLGTCNLVFWDIFSAAESMAMGYVATSGHGLFTVLELCAAYFASAPESRTQRSVLRSA
jgi:hypothetical protein